MITKIYDFTDGVLEIALPDKEIESIYVRVISGDEVVEFNFVDGSSIEFDASDIRSHDYNDGQYTVEGAGVQKWLHWDPERKEDPFDLNSYARRDEFSKKEGL